MSCIAVTIDPECGVSDADGHAACLALDAQAREFCTATGKEYTPVIFFSSDVLTKLEGDELTAFTTDCRLLTVRMSIDAPGALGYHDDVAGVIFANVLMGPEWTVTASHEVLEEIGDVTCDSYKPWTNGDEQAEEYCDRVEGDTYRVEGTLVSNYLLPSAFVPGSEGPWDKLGQLTKWDGMTGGGYVIVRTSDGATSDVFAETAHAKAKAERKRAKLGGRTARRLAAVREVPATPVSEPKKKGKRAS